MKQDSATPETIKTGREVITRGTRQTCRGTNDKRN